MLTAGNSHTELRDDEVSNHENLGQRLISAGTTVSGREQQNILRLQSQDNRPSPET